MCVKFRGQAEITIFYELEELYQLRLCGPWGLSQGLQYLLKLSMDLIAKQVQTNKTKNALSVAPRSCAYALSAHMANLQV